MGCFDFFATRETIGKQPPDSVPLSPHSVLEPIETQSFKNKRSCYHVESDPTPYLYGIQNIIQELYQMNKDDFFILWHLSCSCPEAYLYLLETIKTINLAYQSDEVGSIGIVLNESKDELSLKFSPRFLKLLVETAAQDQIKWADKTVIKNLNKFIQDHQELNFEKPPIPVETGNYIPMPSMP